MQLFARLLRHFGLQLCNNSHDSKSVSSIDESNVEDCIKDNHDDVEYNQRADAQDHEPAQFLHLVCLKYHSVEDDQRDAEEVEDALVHQVLDIDELALPLGLVEDKGHHDETSCKQQEHSKEGGLLHKEEDHGCVEHSSEHKDERVKHSHVVWLVLL